MLSRPADFAAIQESGIRLNGPYLSLRLRATGLDVTRFGLATGRQLGGAVERNRARRRIREALREVAPSIQPGWDVLIIARPAVDRADYRTLAGGLHRLLRRGGVVADRTGT